MSSLRLLPLHEIAKDWGIDLTSLKRFAERNGVKSRAILDPGAKSFRIVQAYLAEDVEKLRHLRLSKGLSCGQEELPEEEDQEFIRAIRHACGDVREVKFNCTLRNLDRKMKDMSRRPCWACAEIYRDGTTEYKNRIWERRRNLKRG